jgi:hypothetical protein
MITHTKRLIYTTIFHKTSYRPEVNENIIVDRICTSINSVDTSNCLLLGDFNFRQINWNKMEASSGLTEKFLNTIQDNLLTQIVDEPTRGNNIFVLLGMKVSTRSL